MKGSRPRIWLWNGRTLIGSGLLAILLVASIVVLSGLPGSWQMVFGRPDQNVVQSVGTGGTSGMGAASAKADQPKKIPTEPAPFVGSRAPNFTLKDLDGRSVRLEDLRGKVVFMNFWASWCLPCREEMPAIQRMHETMRGQVTVIGVNLMETKDVVGKFVKGNRYTWTFLLDDGNVAATYLVRFLPTTFFIDQKGVIRSVVPGPMDYDQMVRKIKETAKYGL